MYSSEDTLIIIKTILEYIYRIYLNFLIIYIDDKYLYRYNKPIIYEDLFTLDDNNEDLIKLYKRSSYDDILKLCNIDKTLKRYSKKKFKCENTIVIKSFLFNFKHDKIVNNKQFTNKLVMIHNIYNSISIKTINELSYYDYNYLYVLFKTNKNDIKIKIIDLTNNYNLVNNTIMPFDIITLS